MHAHFFYIFAIKKVGMHTKTPRSHELRGGKIELILFVLRAQQFQRCLRFSSCLQPRRP